MKMMQSKQLMDESQFVIQILPNIINVSILLEDRACKVHQSKLLSNAVLRATI